MSLCMLYSFQVPDLLQGCGVKEAGTGSQVVWLQEFRVSCCLRPGLPLWPSCSGAGCLRCSAAPRCGGSGASTLLETNLCILLSLPGFLWIARLSYLRVLAAWVSVLRQNNPACIWQWPASGPLPVAPGISCHWPPWLHPDPTLGLSSHFE